ncbi:MAG TPA: response regulator [Thermodesulfobacteriota bacterium]|nr:response regulator [Thermodesulfobacteriota bacterium]
MRTILVADEDIRVVNLVRLTFTEHMGYNVVAVSDGAYAILKAGEIKPDVILVDVSLSNHNGYSVSREIKNAPLLKDVYVILLCSGFVSFDERKVFAARADDVITKPFKPEELTKKVLGRFAKKGIGQISSSKKGKVENKDVLLNETTDIKVSEKISAYVTVLAAFLHLIINNIKNIYLSLNAYTESLKVHVEKVELKSVTSRLKLRVDSFGTLWGKIHLPVMLVNKWGLQSYVKGYLRSFCVVPGLCYKQVKSAISGLRKLLIPYAALRAKSFNLLSPHFGRKYSFISALGIGTVLLIIIPMVFADKREEGISSSSGGLISFSTFPELRTSPEVVVAHNNSSDNVSNKVPKVKVTSFGPDANIPKEEFLGVKEKRGKEQSPLPELTQKVEKTRTDKYVVRSGDTLWKIANKFNVSLEALRAVNNIRGDKIYSGEVLTIPHGVIRKEIRRWDVIETATHSGGIRIIDWSFYTPWSGVAVIHHILIENTSDMNYNNIKVRVHYYTSSDDNRTRRGEITATLPILVPPHSKKVYLKEGLALRGDFNINGMNVKNQSIEIVEAAPLKDSHSYSSR